MAYRESRIIVIKSKRLYACQHCGAQYPKWSGQCSDCGKWNTLVEEAHQTISASSSRSGSYARIDSAAITCLADVELTELARTKSGMSELDRVLGGGLVAGSVVLIGGDPGIGKSTLLLQTLCALSQSQNALYVTGEESLQQVSLRAHRLGLPANNMQLLTETCVERIIQLAKKHKPQVMVVDSIQTIFSEQLQSVPGSVGQVREGAQQLVRFAKASGTTVFFSGPCD